MFIFLVLTLSLKDIIGGRLWEQRTGIVVTARDLDIWLGIVEIGESNKKGNWNMKKARIMDRIV